MKNEPSKLTLSVAHGKPIGDFSHPLMPKRATAPNAPPQATQITDCNAMVRWPPDSAFKIAQNPAAIKKDTKTEGLSCLFKFSG
jgi:hypothetical protein